MNYIKNQYDYVIIISHLDQIKYQSDHVTAIDKKNNFGYVNTSSKKLIF
jgi:DNA repair exonuclease SbcCD ATPase subunit